MKERNSVLVVIFTILTAGIYGIYWIVSVQNGLKRKTGMGFSGGGTILAMVFSFGIYGIYWPYALGKRLHAAGASRDYSVLFLLLALFLPCLGVYAYMFLAQEAINEIGAQSDDDDDDDDDSDDDGDDE